jgi:hypothetical protein
MMHSEQVRIIMAVENAVLRNALLSALAPLDCSPEVILPDALMQAELSGFSLIFLETSNDVERLVATATYLWTKWGETGHADVHFLSYSTREVTPDSVVFRLWSIGSEMTVIVQDWQPDTLKERQLEASVFTRRILDLHRKASE